VRTRAVRGTSDVGSGGIGAVGCPLDAGPDGPIEAELVIATCMVFDGWPGAVVRDNRPAMPGPPASYDDSFRRNAAWEFGIRAIVI
jgi:hypothetical protein